MNDANFPTLADDLPRPLPKFDTQARAEDPPPQLAGTVYVVNTPDREALSEHTDPADAVAAFEDIPGERRPFIVREQHRDGGTHSGSVVANTSVTEQGGVASYGKWINPELTDMANVVQRATTPGAPRVADARDPAVPLPPAANAAPTVPEANNPGDQHGSWANRFVHVGNDWMTQHGDLAFSERGGKLRTALNSKMVAGAMVERADEMGWDSIKVKGADEFKAAVWAKAASKGIAVQGYTPTTFELAQQDGRAGHASADGAADPGRPDAAPQLAPRLVEYGRAPYKNDADNSASYYVTTQADSGAKATVWGVGLADAIDRSGAVAGDRVNIEQTGKEDVPVKVRQPDGSFKEETKQRNGWRVDVAERSATGAEHDQAPGTLPDQDGRAILSDLASKYDSVRVAGYTSFPHPEADSKPVPFAVVRDPTGERHLLRGEDLVREMKAADLDAGQRFAPRDFAQEQERQQSRGGQRHGNSLEDGGPKPLPGPSLPPGNGHAHDSDWER